jgi:hypothetical protein
VEIKDPSPITEKVKDEEARPKKKVEPKRNSCHICGKEFKIHDVPQTLKCNHKAHLNCFK